MVETSGASNPWLYRIALLTTVVALLPIVVGALVTTLRAGMAFADWPSSDGHNMFSYPWLQSQGDKFVEHGHRLAGVLIGLLSIALALIVRLDPRRWVRVFGFVILLAVIAQGLLGGLRVLADENVAALVHGGLAAWIFTLMAIMVLVTSRSWAKTSHQVEKSDMSRLKPFVVLTPIVLFAQYTLGGMVRHLGLALFEHLGFAVISLLMVIATVVVLWRSKIAWLRRPAMWLLAFVCLQILLGVGSWLTKYGFPPSGYVAVQNSVEQQIVRTSHTVVGIVLLMTSVICAVRVFRVEHINRNAALLSLELSAACPVAGGVG